MRGHGLRMIAFGVLCLLVSCVGKGPQRPSQRKGTVPAVDSTQLALMELNQQLALAADRQISQLAQAQEENYALYERGVWATILEMGDSERENPQPEEQCAIHMRIYSLSGTLYSDIEQTFRVGRHEVPEAIDENIGEWHHGARVRLLAPWYAAYGLQGTDNIPPYENVIIEIELR